MAAVNASDSATSTYLKAVLDRRAKDIEERISQGTDAGKLSKKDQNTLDALEKQNEKALAKATSDGMLDRAEYQRLAKALESESKSLDRMLKVKTPASNTGATGSNRAMQDQDGTLKLIQDMQKRMHQTIQKALSSGTISKAQGKSMDTLENSEQDVIDKALADGVVSKGEYAQIAKVQGNLSTKLKQYQREYSKASRSGRYSGKA
ncbi:hypothetical protein [Fundidesulfovibrio terrae]|uniref:hypothetical protein n=1 Tax=Fundidesulfovibrio terrae TaxID=2922866 RepID=UPI001FAFD980|nr:hypothetical protein [Fundidesulfovibrio terrae]